MCRNSEGVLSGSTHLLAKALFCQGNIIISNFLLAQHVTNVIAAGLFIANFFCLWSVAAHLCQQGNALRVLPRLPGNWVLLSCCLSSP